MDKFRCFQSPWVWTCGRINKPFSAALDDIDTFGDFERTCTECMELFTQRHCLVSLVGALLAKL
jgi:hypothetical protein